MTRVHLDLDDVAQLRHPPNTWVKRSDGWVLTDEHGDIWGERPWKAFSFGTPPRGATITGAKFDWISYNEDPAKWIDWDLAKNAGPGALTWLTHMDERVRLSHGRTYDDAKVEPILSWRGESTSDLTVSVDMLADDHFNGDGEARGSSGVLNFSEFADAQTRAIADVYKVPTHLLEPVSFRGVKFLVEKAEVKNDRLDIGVEVRDLSPIRPLIETVKVDYVDFAEHSGGYLLPKGINLNDFPTKFVGKPVTIRTFDPLPDPKSPLTVEHLRKLQRELSIGYFPSYKFPRHLRGVEPTHTNTKGVNPMNLTKITIPFIQTTPEARILVDVPLNHSVQAVSGDASNAYLHIATPDKQGKGMHATAFHVVAEGTSLPGYSGSYRGQERSGPPEAQDGDDPVQLRKIGSFKVEDEVFFVYEA